MKKLLLINLAILLSVVGFSQGAFPVPTGKGSIEASAFRQRVADSGGTYYPNVAAHEIDERTSYGLNPVFEYYPAAVETSVAFSQKPTDGTGDFTVTRAGIKTRVNEDGYLEEIAANIAAIDYTTGIPALKTEKAATNLLTQSNAFGNTYWTKSGATIEGDASTAGSELVLSSFINTPATTDFNTFDGASTTGFHAISTADGDEGNKRATSVDELALESGTIYKVSWTNTIASGATPLFSIRQTYNAGTYAATEVNNVSGATNYIIFTCTSTDTYQAYFLSQAVTEFTISDFTLTTISGFSSPSVDYPTDGYKLVEDVGTASDYNFNRNNIVVNNTSNTMSICVKAGERNWVALYDGETNEGYYFDLTNGVVGSALGSAPDSYSITPLVDSWYRISVTVTTTTAKIDWYFYLAESDGGFTYNGDGTSGLYIYGAQVEESSYPTSPIYTSGATASRIADAITGAGNAALFSSVNSSGVLYAEIAALSDDLTERRIVLSDGSNDNRITISLKNQATAIRYIITVATVSQADATVTGYTQTDFNKIAVRWAVNDFSLWINGVEVATDVSGSIFSASTLSEVTFNVGDGGSSYFYGNTRQVAVYNYLTDTQMATLTTP